jgi:hypothetical protein
VLSPVSRPSRLLVWKDQKTFLNATPGLAHAGRLGMENAGINGVLAKTLLAGILLGLVVSIRVVGPGWCLVILYFFLKFEKRSLPVWSSMLAACLPCILPATVAGTRG